MRSNSKPVSQRQLRVGEQIRHILADCFQRGNVPTDLLDIPPVSVMEVKVSSDFSYCKAFVSFLTINTVDNVDLVKKMNANAGFFRGILAKKLMLRLTPEIKFMADAAQAEADRIEALLARPDVRRDLEKKPDEEEAADD